MEFDFNQQPGKFRRDIRYDSSVKPLMSIVTAYFNAGKYFEQTFNSVMNQTFPWFEWIIVNDGSTNSNDIKILKELTCNENRIKIINQNNGGAANARNTGIKHTTTEIIVPLDADDLIAPQYLEYTFWGLYYNPDAAWCYTWSTGFQDIEYLWRFPWDAEKLKTYNYLTLTAAIRKKDLLEVGGYKTEDFLDFEDWRFWLEMLAKHKKPVAVGGYLFWYRRLESGRLSSTRKDPKQEQLAENLIKEISRKADGSVKAIEFPLIKTAYPYYEPRMPQMGSKYIVNSDCSKIRILMLVPWMIMGGADKFNLDYIENIDKDKFDVCLITTEKSENEWQQKFEKNIFEVFNLSEFLDPAHYLEFLGYYIESRKIDVLMITNSYCGYYMIPWIRKQFPHICIIDYVHMEEWYWKAGGFARISGMMGGFIDRTYTCNSATRDVLIKSFDRFEDSVKTMYIGVDAGVFNRDIVKPGYLYDKYDIQREKYIILFPCRIHPQKRPFMMLDIAEKVHKRNKNALFVVVGDGEQLEELKNTVHNRKIDEAVMCIGRSDNMKECYRDAKLTLICSLKEGLALTAYESCAMGVPVISSDVGGQRDLIDSTVGRLIKTTQNEETEFDNRKFDYSEIEEFVDAILLFLNDSKLYEECSRNCRKKIEDTFSTKLMSQNMQNEILDLLSDNEIKRQHLEMSQMLQRQGKYAEEFYTSHLTYEERDMECGEMWRAKCYLEEEMLRREREGELGELFRRLSVCEGTINRHEEVVNRHEEVINRHEEVVNRHEEVVNRHEEVINRHEEVVNRHEEVVNRHEEVINRHEEVVNRHEEVVNRHEEVINRHEEVVNDDWAWLKKHEDKIREIGEEKNRKLLGLFRKLRR